jgi:hypothetical protein
MTYILIPVPGKIIMMQPIPRRHAPRWLAFAATCIGMLTLLALPWPARAGVWIGFGVPFFVAPWPYYPPPPPPVYVYPAPAYPPPPAYYAPPPPAGYAPDQPGSPSAAPAQSCYAGANVCPMETAVPPGAACYCTDPNGVRIWGNAN